MRTLVMVRRPSLSFLFQRAQVATPDEALCDKAPDAMQRPRPARERLKRRRGPREVNLVDPAQVVRPRGVAEPDAQRAVEEEGLHDPVVRRAVADPPGAHLLHVELVSAVGAAVVV